jgi:uncharacterized RDD family membrane protein YckC
LNFLLAVQPVRATEDVAPFGRRLAALALDAGLLLVAVFVLITSANFAGPVALFHPFWRESPVVLAERDHATREDDRLPDGGGRRTIDIVRETRHHADGTIRIWAIAAGEIRWDDGRVEPVRSELLVGRNLIGFVRSVATQLLLVLLPFFYFAAFESSAWQASPGKRAMGVRVVDLAGRRLSFARALVRQFLKLCEVAATGFGYLLAAVTGTGQAFHDILVGTRVVRAQETTGR